MRAWTAERVAGAAGARLLSAPATAGGPSRATIDSRTVGAGALFVGLPGSALDGGAFAADALRAGAWGALTAPAHAAEAAEAARSRPEGAAVMIADDPLLALQELAAAWRRGLGARVVGVTGSTGKTSTKELLRALLEPHARTVASAANFNTEIGLPLEIIGAPESTEALVLEMGMRGRGQIAQLARIAAPEVGVIVSVGPVHLELLGTVQNIAAAKAELIAGLPAGGTAIVPADEPLLAPHLRADVTTVTFGERGDVRLVGRRGRRLAIDASGRPVELEVDFQQAHLVSDLLAAVAAALAVGVVPSGHVAYQPGEGRGRRRTLAGGVTVIDDCYNANPISMRAALDDLMATVGARRVAVLGDMLELGPEERRYHVSLGEQAAAAGVDVLVAVGRLAAAVAEGFAGECHALSDAQQASEVVTGLLTPGDVVLVKGSRGVGLERVCRALGAREDTP